MRIAIMAITLELLLGGCGDTYSQPATSQVPATDTNMVSLGLGVFRLTGLAGNSDGSARYTAVANDSCRFEVLVGAIKPSDGAPFSIKTGAIVRQPGSDCAEFLRALAPTLGFTGAMPTPAPAGRLDASMAILGMNQSRESENAEVAGGFTSDPAGNWLVTKLFLADGEGEVFLNLNPKDGVGEFSVKDEEYGAVVVTESARVLLPARPGA